MLLGLFVAISMVLFIYLLLGYMVWIEYGIYHFNKVELLWFRAWALSVLFLWPVIVFFGVWYFFFKEIEEIWSGRDRQ